VLFRSERLEASEQHPRGVGIEDRPHRVPQRADRVHPPLGARDPASDEVGVAAGVLGQRIDDDVGPVVEGALPQRAEEGDVDRDRRRVVARGAGGAGGGGGRGGGGGGGGGWGGGGRGGRGGGGGGGGPARGGAGGRGRAPGPGRAAAAAGGRVAPGGVASFRFVSLT